MALPHDDNRYEFVGCTKDELVEKLAELMAAIEAAHEAHGPRPIETCVHPACDALARHRWA